MNMFLRQEIEAIDIGTNLNWGLGYGTFSGPYEVVSITCRREDIHGKLFVHGYFRWGNDSRMSFSIKEGREDKKFYEIVK